MDTPQPTYTDQQLKRLLWLVAVGFFMQTLDATIVNTALPAMALGLQESPLHMQSVVVAYALTMAMLIPLSGWLADRFGTRKVFLGAILVFVVASLLCGLSTSLWQLVLARIAQGAGGALLLPVGRLSVLRAFPRERFLAAMSFVAIPGLVGSMLGPTLGGLLVQYASWHWVFLVNVPVGLLGWLAARQWMIDFSGDQQRKLDIAGYGLLAFGMVLVSLSVDGVSGLGWPRGAAVLCMVLGLVCFATYWLRAARQPYPLFSPSLFKVPTLAIGLLGNLVSRLGSSAVPFLIPLLLQLQLGFSPAQAGLMMLPVSLAAMMVKRFATWSITRYGYRRVLVANTLCVGGLIASFASLHAGLPVPWLVVHFAAFGACNSLQFTAMNTLTLRDMSTEQASSGNSLLSMTQMLAMSLGVGLAAAVLAGFNDIVHSQEHPDQVMVAFRYTFLCMGCMTMMSSAIFWQLSARSHWMRSNTSDAL